MGKLQFLPRLRLNHLMNVVLAHQFSVSDDLLVDSVLALEELNSNPPNISCVNEHVWYFSAVNHIVIRHENGAVESTTGDSRNTCLVPEANINDGESQSLSVHVVVHFLFRVSQGEDASSRGCAPVAGNEAFDSC